MSYRLPSSYHDESWGGRYQKVTTMGLGKSHGDDDGSKGPKQQKLNDAMVALEDEAMDHSHADVTAGEVKIHRTDFKAGVVPSVAGSSPRDYFLVKPGIPKRTYDWNQGQNPDDREKAMSMTEEGAAGAEGKKKPSKTGCPLPLDDETVDALLCLSQQAGVGVEGKGDVYDSSLRLTQEVSADRLPLAPRFRNFEFPEVRQHVAEALCPSALDVRFEPYKLLIYQPGDFFTVHVDTMHHPQQFGSLALEVPLSMADSDSWCNSLDHRMPDYTSLTTDSASDEALSSAKISLDAFERGGELVFYSGNLLDDADQKKSGGVPGGSVEPPKTLRNRRWASYGVDRTDSNRLVTRISLLSNCEDNPTRRERREERRDQDASKSDDDDDIKEVKRDRRKAKNTKAVNMRLEEGGSSRDEGTLTLKYAAWLGDIPHEVRRLKSGYRVTLVYNLIRVGHKPLHIPRAPQLVSAVDNILTLIDRFKPCLKRGGGGSGGEKVALHMLHSIGIALRHPYTPAGLSPENLKGIDAVLYGAVSPHYECYLALASEHRVDYASTPFRRSSKDKEGDLLQKHLYLCADMTQVQPEEFLEKLGESTWQRKYKSAASINVCPNQERAQDELENLVPMIGHCLWGQVGHGTLLGGGSSYGNADCGAAWWYKACALVINGTKGGPWKRRRGAMLAGLRARGGRSSTARAPGGSRSNEDEECPMRRLYSVRDVFCVILQFL